MQLLTIDPYVCRNYGRSWRKEDFRLSLSDTVACLKLHHRSCLSLHKKCPSTKYFLVHIFLYSVRIQENTDQKILRIGTLFTQCVDSRWLLLTIFVTLNCNQYSVIVFRYLVRDPLQIMLLELSEVERIN